MTTPVLFERHDGRIYSEHIMSALDMRLSDIKADPSSPFAVMSGDLLRFMGYVPFASEVNEYLANVAPKYFSPDQIGRFVSSELYARIMNFADESCPKGEPPQFLGVETLIHLTSMVLPVMPQPHVGSYRLHECDEHNPRSSKHPSPQFPILVISSNEVAALVREVRQGKAVISHHLPVSILEVAVTFPPYLFVNGAFSDLTVREYVNLSALHSIPIDKDSSPSIPGRFSMSYYWHPELAAQDLESVRAVTPEGMAMVWFYIAGMGERGKSIKNILPAIEYAAQNLEEAEAFQLLRTKEFPKLRVMTDFHKRGISLSDAARCIGKITPAALSKAMKSGMDIDLILSVYDAA